MSTSAVSKFRAINDFPELVEYLGYWLDWPIQTDDFEEMTFDYSAEELGLDAKTAPKFLEIRRLRPLDKYQPWGIFFIRFEESKLPVVALRRLLSKLALKKRSTSNNGDRASWHENDLLLISQTGAQDEKSISFAHFASNPEKTDLPILKVLGWDNDDTGLKIDYVIETLREKLIWPDDPSDSDAWRAQWRDAFTLKNREVIQSSKEMAERLGQLALAVRTRLRELLAIESDEGPIHKLMSVFKENLISDLDTDSFSDMYAQTIAYGLLSARIINPKANTADAAHTQIPITNPFLRDLMETFLNVGGRSHSSGVGLDFDELGINEVVDLLDNTNMEAVLRDFGDRNQKEDPVMHFFEGFLQEYDSKIRKDRGVFYTPQPVVSFIVRSVDEQLRTEFGLKDGLADTTTWGELARQIEDLKIPDGTSPDQAFIQILDPATGTGTFPVEVIDLIYKTMTAKWQAQGSREAQIKELWNEYVPKFLLPRLHGYELMMAPYAIAHMKIGLKLYETGYSFKSDERARIYLTNALEPAQDYSGTFAFAIPALAHEAEAVNAIKRDQRFTVVIGNPPYSKLSSNLTKSVRALVEPYKYLEGEKIRERGALQFEMNLQDDYVKFTRLMELVIADAGAGVMGLISNGGYLTNPTLVGMRYSLATTFSSVSLIDLHGHGASLVLGDENVFDIQQGVSIGVLCRRTQTESLAEVSYASLVGAREEKYRVLSAGSVVTLPFESVRPKRPYFQFMPLDDDLRNEFDSMISLAELFPRNSAGFITSRDSLVIDSSVETLKRKIRKFANDRREDSEVYETFNFKPSKRLDLRAAQKAVLVDEDITGTIRPCLYRPFDSRFIYYNRQLIESYKPIARDMDMTDNLGLLATRQVTRSQFEHVFVASAMIELKSCSHDRNTQFFPLYTSQSAASDRPDMFGAGFVPNLSIEALDRLSESIGLEAILRSGGGEAIDPKSVFHYCYATLHSPAYRKRYFELLQFEFPRVPLSPTHSVFHELVRIGSDLVNLHLMKVPFLTTDEVVSVGLQPLQVEKVSYLDQVVWIDKARTSGFKGVPKDVWNFRIGGYQVCEKWLKDRGPKKGNPGRVLSEEEINHYKKIVVTLGETIRIMGEIDSVIESHGGWPDAFATKSE
ncbi:hypothetical protein N9R01_00800 [Porticoccaceae bacterium]|nr:hypothetical protein [Porticoccaceae bacterium]